MKPSREKPEIIQGVKKNSVESKKISALAVKISNVSPEKKVLTHYFNKNSISYADSENFFGNGIVLHKLRTSSHARYFNSICLVKMLAFEPILVSLQMVPGLQISILAAIQGFYVFWLAYCGFREKIFISKAIFVATLVCDTSIMVFLLLGLGFHMSGGAKNLPTSTSTPLQFAGVALLLLSCLFGVVDLMVSTWIVIKTTLDKRKIQKYLDELKKTKEKQEEESMMQLHDEATEKKANPLESSSEVPQSLLDRRNLSPFWQLKFRKGRLPVSQDTNLNRPDLRFG
jgi:hypothetical protein